MAYNKAESTITSVIKQKKYILRNERNNTATYEASEMMYQRHLLS